MKNYHPAQPHTKLAGPKTVVSTTQIKQKTAQGFKEKPQRPNRPNRPNRPDSINVSAAKAKLLRAKFTSMKEHQSHQTTKSCTESSD